MYQKSVNEFLQQNLFYFPRIDKGYNFSRRYIPQQNNSENFDVRRKQEKFVGEISAYGYRIEFDREFPVACSLDIVLAPENVVNAKKKIIKKED